MNGTNNSAVYSYHCNRMPCLDHARTLCWYVSKSYPMTDQLFTYSVQEDVKILSAYYRRGNILRRPERMYYFLDSKICPKTGVVALRLTRVLSADRDSGWIQGKERRRGWQRWGIRRSQNLSLERYRISMVGGIFCGFVTFRCSHYCLLVCALCQSSARFDFSRLKILSLPTQILRTCGNKRK